MHRPAAAVTAVLETDLGRHAPSKVTPRKTARKPAKLTVSPTLPALPSLATSKHFLNLTNGLEAVPLLESLHLSYGYCSACIAVQACMT